MIPVRLIIITGTAIAGTIAAYQRKKTSSQSEPTSAQPPRQPTSREVALKRLLEVTEAKLREQEARAAQQAQDVKEVKEKLRQYGEIMRRQRQELERLQQQAAEDATRIEELEAQVCELNKQIDAVGRALPAPGTGDGEFGHA